MAVHLIHRGVDVNRESVYMCYSPLQLAAECGKTELVELLLEKGAHVKKINAHMRNAHMRYANPPNNLMQPSIQSAGLLQSAAIQGNVRMGQLLIEHGAEIDDHTSAARTALTTACFNRNEQMVALLLRHGADPNAPSNTYTNRLVAACIEPNERIVDLLLSYGALDLDSSGFYGSALRCAAKAGNCCVVQKLLPSNLDDETRCRKLPGPLVSAAQAGYGDIVKILLEYGADINAVVEEDLAVARGLVPTTALHAASRGGKPDVVQLLLNYGADVNITIPSYGTALDKARVSGSGSDDSPGALDKVVQILEAAGGEKAFPAMENATLASPDIGKLFDIMFPILRPSTCRWIPDGLNDTLYRAAKEYVTVSDDTQMSGPGTFLVIVVKKIDLPQDIPPFWIEALNTVPLCDNDEDVLRTVSVVVSKKLDFDQELPKIMTIYTRLNQASSGEEQCQILLSELGVESFLKNQAFLEEFIVSRPSAFPELGINVSKLTPLVESFGVKEETVHFLIELIGLKPLAAQPRPKRIRSILNRLVARRWKKHLAIL